MNEGIYYLRLNGQVEGPFSIGQIYDLWAARKINSQTLFARFEEMDKWQPLSELTLKISAPKIPLPKLPTPEMPSAQPPKHKAPATPRPEEYAPSVVFKTEPRPVPGESRRESLRILPKEILFSFSYSIGFCIILGVAVTAYSMFFLSASPDGKEINQSVLMMKQNGVIAGMGLILMGGLLIVARQISQILSAIRGEGSSRDSQRKPQSTA